VFPGFELLGRVEYVCSADDDARLLSVDEYVCFADDDALLSSAEEWSVAESVLGAAGAESLRHSSDWPSSKSRRRS
jgi:hypothetical protein